MAEIKIKADSNGGTVSLKGPATTTGDAAIQLTLPVDDGAANQYLKTDGSGALSWATVTDTDTVTTINNNADNRVITGSGTANTLEGESNLTFNGTQLDLGHGDSTFNRWQKNQLRFNGDDHANIDHYTTGKYIKFRTSASSGADSTVLQLYPTGFISAVTTGFGQFRKTNTGVLLDFQHGTTQVGNIGIGSSSTSYNTSSDYRLKENVSTISDGITRVKQLKPSKFNWIIDDTNTPVDGFLAHEVSSLVPEAVSGAKDAVDSDNNPVHQCIDQSKLVPLLTAALKEAITKIETLETKVAALEAG